MGYLDSFIHSLFGDVSPTKLALPKLPPTDSIPIPSGTCSVMLNSAEATKAFNQVLWRGLNAQKEKAVGAKTTPSQFRYEPYDEVATITPGQKIFRLPYASATFKGKDHNLVLEIKDKYHKSLFAASDGGSVWGVVEANGDSASPPDFKADAIDTGDGWKITAVQFKLAIKFDIIDENSPAWQDAGTKPKSPAGDFPGVSGLWGEGQRLRQYRGNTSLEERKYWAFQHEVDHLRAWIEYWEIILEHTLVALDRRFEDEKSCRSYIEKIKYNVHLNWQVAKKRSSFFDAIYPPQVTSYVQDGKEVAVPAVLPGGLYHRYKTGLFARFPHDMEFVWLDSAKIENRVPLKGVTNTCCTRCSAGCNL